MFSQLLTWVAMLPIALAMVVVWVGSTYFWLRLLKLPPAISLVAAPPVTTTVVLVLSIVYQKVGVYWSGVYALPVLALIGAIGATQFWRRPRHPQDVSPLSPTFWLSVAIGFVLAVLPLMLVAPVTNPVQQWDPSFHMNGVWGMTQLGVGAPGEGLAHNYGGTWPSNYPMAWHSITALFATGPTVVQVSNASSLALSAVWVVGAGIFTYILYPSRRAACAAAVISGTTLGMPADALGAYSQWPNAMSLAFLPGVATLGVFVGRAYLVRITAALKGSSARRSDEDVRALPARLTVPATAVAVPHAFRDEGSALPIDGGPRQLQRSVSPGLLAAWTVVTILATYGGILAHQVFAFNLAVLLTPALLASMGVVIGVAVRQRKIWAAVVTASLVVPGASVLAYVLMRPEVRSMANYPRAGVSMGYGIKQALLPTPPFPETLGLILYPVLLTGLVFAGVGWILAARGPRLAGSMSPRRVASWKPPAWPIWSAAAFATLVFFAYGPNWPIRTWVVGPWFNDGRRIMEPEGLILASLAAFGFVWLSELAVGLWAGRGAKPTRRQKSLVSWFIAAVLLSGSVFGAMDTRIAAARSVLDPDALGKPGMATQGVLDMMGTLDDILPEDAIVLGDPQAGAMYSQMIGQRWAYFPQLSYLNKDRETQKILVQRFKSIHEDPAVCEAVLSEGITHYFEAEDGYYYSRLRSDRSPGLYGVDTSEGFELVAQGDGSSLYKITACD